MDRKTFHIGAGDMPGIVWDAFSAEVDALLTGATILGVVDLNTAQAAMYAMADMPLTFRPALIYFEVEAAVLVTGVPTVSIGTNGPSYNNILTATALTGLTTAGYQAVLLPSVPSAIANQGETVYMNVTVGALVGLGGSFTLDVSVIGLFTT